MHRIDTSTKAADLFGAGKHGFKDGDKANGIPATDLTAAFFNDLSENLAILVEACGIALAKGNYSQLLQAIAAKVVQGRVFDSAAAGGTADALTGTFGYGVMALVNGLTVTVRAASANATTTPTFTPNNGVIAAKTIVKGNNLPLVAGDIAGAGHWLELQYDLTLDRWVLLNPAFGVSNGTAFASNAEAQAFSVSNKAISPATLAAAFQGSNQSLAAAGYQKLPGGLIVQWGQVSYSSGTGSGTFPITFPTACLACTVTAYDATVGPKPNVTGVTTSGFSIRDSDTTGNVLVFLAIGN